MPNIQVIDGAENCTYGIFETSEDGFRLIFPGEGQDVEFADDFIARVGGDKAGDILREMWKHRVEKKVVCGIHGTLFYELEDKKQYYPTKKESEMSMGFYGSAVGRCSRPS